MTDLEVRAPSMNGGAVVRKEPMTYERHMQRSYLLDMVRAELMSDMEARDRLNRHQVEMDVERRTNPNTTAGTGGEFAPPLWAIPYFSPAMAVGRVLADLIDYDGNLMPLPQGVSSVNVPRINAGATAAVQPNQPQPVVSTDPTTANAQGQGQVVTIAGDVDVSQQLLDLTPTPGLDSIIGRELNSNYNQNLEVELLTGSGINGHVLGLKNVTGAVSVSGAGIGTSIVVTSLWPLIGQVMAGVGNKRGEPVQYIIMAPRRWAMIGAGAIDSSNRPISSPGSNSPALPGYPTMGGPEATNRNRLVGPIGSCPVAQSGAILTGSINSTATNASADDMYFIRPKDLLLWESAPKLMVSAQSLGGTLQVRIRFAKYVAFIPNRYPGGIGLLTGMPQPTNY